MHYKLWYASFKRTSQHAGLGSRHPELCFQVFGRKGGESHQVEVKAGGNDAADENRITDDPTDGARHVYIQQKQM